jgi:hypothetical protein
MSLSLRSKPLKILPALNGYCTCRTQLAAQVGLAIFCLCRFAPNRFEIPLVARVISPAACRSAIIGLAAFLNQNFSFASLRTALTFLLALYAI